MSLPTPSHPTRRGFLGATASAAIVASAASAARAAAVHVSVDDVLKVGLIGCGGRGTGAARQALDADKNVKLWAMGDAFEDRVEGSLKTLGNVESVASKLDVPKERRFAGFDAYQKVIDSGVDVVLLASPPHFRPMHMEAAVKANKHIFAEKPVATDSPGVRKVLELCEEAKKKSLSVVSGLCLRSSFGFRELVQRVYDGQIGQLTSIQANDYRGPIWVKPRQEGWSDMTYQMRNWYYFTWLSGDFNVEQHIHFLDVAAWLMNNEYPVRAIGMGGREVRRGPEYGNIYDHHSVVYEYENGTKLYSNTRQIPGCKGEISCTAMGTKGHALVSERRRGAVLSPFDKSAPWVYEGKDNNIYQTEHDELFASIRSGKPMNNGEYMCKSTMLAIMGRMATYTGQLVTWDKAWNSKEDLSPPAYNWDVKLPEPPAAVPGVTKLV